MSNNFEQAYKARRRIRHGWSTNVSEDVVLVCQSPKEAATLMEYGWEKLTSDQLGQLADAVSTSALYSKRAVAFNSFSHLAECKKKQLQKVASGSAPSFGVYGANLTIKLGGDDPYFRPWNDQDKGGVWNTPTLNQYDHLVAGGWTGDSPTFPSFSAKEADNLLMKGKKVGQDLFDAGEGVNFSIVYDAELKKLVVSNLDKKENYFI